MTKRIRTTLAALAIAFAIALSAGAFGFSQADVAGSRPPKDAPMVSKSPFVVMIFTNATAGVKVISPILP